jgi:hypothetical protein
VSHPAFISSAKKETKKKTRELALAVRSIILNSRWRQLVDFGAKAFVFLAVFAREMDRGKMNSFLVVPGWLKLISEIKLIQVRYPGVLSDSELATMLKVLKQDFAKYMRPGFFLFFLLAPSLRSMVLQIAEDDPDFHQHMLRQAKMALLELQKRFSHKGRGFASNPSRSVPQNERDQLLQEFDQ